MRYLRADNYSTLTFKNYKQPKIKLHLLFLGFLFFFPFNKKQHSRFWRKKSKNWQATVHISSVNSLIYWLQ